MKFRQKNDLTVDGVRSGFPHRDSIMLRKKTDYKPRIQTFTFEDEEEEPEQRQYFCAVDRSRLDYHKYLDIWLCSECYQQYDTKIQDKPIKDKSGFRLHSFHNPTNSSKKMTQTYHSLKALTYNRTQKKI